MKRARFASGTSPEFTWLSALLRGKGRNLGLLVAIGVWFAVVTAKNSNFATIDNMRVIGLNMSVTAIAAIGTSILIISGNIDLSIGSIFALAAILAATFSTEMPVAIAFILAIVIAGLIALINGVLCWKVPASPIVITLGSLTLLRGVVLLITHGAPVSDTPSSFTGFGRAVVAGIPMPIIVMLSLALLSAILLGTTTTGRYCYAVGGSKQAAEAAGINVRRITIGAFVYGGLLTGLAGVVTASRFDAPDPTYGVGFELVVITGVLLGGVSFAGGEGSIIGGLLGVLALTLIDAGIVSLGINPYYSSVVQGGLLIIAVSLDQVAHVQRERYQKAMAMREQQRLLEEHRRDAAATVPDST
jgi:ribose/xylose/arabinose/galactoside ABC-type transport system permease subunit